METPPGYNAPPAPAGSQERTWMAYGSLAAGVISLCAWFIPLCGCPITVAGIALGYLGQESPQRTIAYIGIALSTLGLIASVVNAALGAYGGALGQNQFINQLLGQ